MKKRNNALWAALLLAFALIIGMLASCIPTPVKIPDELQGGWTYSPASGIYYRYSFDGFGSYKKDYVIGGEIRQTINGTYTIEGGYLTMQEPKASKYTYEHPEYYYFHEETGDYWIAKRDTGDSYAYPNPLYKGPFTEYGDTYLMNNSETVAGITTSTSTTYTVGSNNVNFSDSVSLKDGSDILLYKCTTTGSATINRVATPPPNLPFFYSYDETYSKNEKKTKYVINGNNLEMYDETGAVTYTRY